MSHFDKFAQSIDTPWGNHIVLLLFSLRGRLGANVFFAIYDVGILFLRLSVNPERLTSLEKKNATGSKKN